MATEQYVGPIASIALGSNYTAASGTITLASSTGLPTVPFFRLRLDNTSKTVLKVTAVAGAVYTVTAESGDGNATTSNFATPVITPGALNQIRTDIRQSGTYAALPSITGQTTGNIYKCTDSQHEFYFNGTAWIPYLVGSVVTIPPTITNQTTTLSANITNVATTLTATAFTTPPSTPFYIMIGTEQMQVTNVTGSTWTIVRGDGGTTAAAHTSGDTITQMVWSWTNYNSAASFQQLNGMNRLKSTALGGGQEWTISLKYPLPAAPCTVYMGLAQNGIHGSNYVAMGMNLWDSAQPTKNIVAFLNFYNGTWYSEDVKQVTNGGFAGGYAGGTATSIAGLVGNAFDVASNFRWKFVDDNTTWYFYSSQNGGETYDLINSAPRNTFLTATHIGMYVSPRNYPVDIKMTHFLTTTP